MRLDTGVKVKMFEKKDLRNKLGFNDLEVKVVMKYQKDFPELLQEHAENNFVIDNRVLWDHLGKPYIKYNHWFKRKVSKQDWSENFDYITRWKKIHLVNDGYKDIENHYFTVESAKHIALSENSTKGKEVRSYFILIERAVRDMDKWILVRNPEKEGWKRLKSALNIKYMETHDGKEAHEWVDIHEANLINKCLFGYEAKEIRKIYKMTDDITRDHMPTEFNNALYEIQILDEGLVLGGIEFKQRRTIVDNYCKNKFKHIPYEVNEYVKASNT